MFQPAFPIVLGRSADLLQLLHSSVKWKSSFSSSELLKGGNFVYFVSLEKSLKNISTWLMLKKNLVSECTQTSWPHF